VNTVAALALPERIKPDLHHGVPVLRLHVGDPIPTPRAPFRYAVHVYPDLARYLLTFNHPQNRKHKPTAIRRYARDMANGNFGFTPEPIIFTSSPVLANGQNRLRAVELSGASVWLMLDFGWPEDVIQRIDRGSARTNADALGIDSVKHAATVAGAYTYVMKYESTVGTPLRWTNTTPTGAEALEAYREHPDPWAEAADWGTRAYRATNGLGQSTWSAAYFILAAVRGSETAQSFYSELIGESGEAGSASRRLKSHYLRRKLSDTSSGDPREPMENIVRAFNAWVSRKPVAFVRTGGSFVLSPVKKA